MVFGAGVLAVLLLAGAGTPIQDVVDGAGGMRRIRMALRMLLGNRICRRTVSRRGGCSMTCLLLVAAVP